MGGRRAPRPIFRLGASRDFLVIFGSFFALFFVLFSCCFFVRFFVVLGCLLGRFLVAKIDKNETLRFFDFRCFPLGFPLLFAFRGVLFSSYFGSFFASFLLIDFWLLFRSILESC